MRSRAKNTIKEWAHDYFVRVNYVDIYGRNVGYDYDYILARLKEQFPEARTSRRWLQMMAYDLNGSVRLPVRRRSRTILSRDYALSLLLKKSHTGLGYWHKNIMAAIKNKFPEKSIETAELLELEGYLRRQNFSVPDRPRG